MKILSIDVGLNNLGLAIVENNKVKSTLLMTEKSKDSVEKRIFSINTKLDSFISTEFSSTSDKVLVFENPYFSFNSDTGKILDYVVGNILYLGYKYDFKIESYTATEIKKTIQIEKPESKIVKEEKPIKCKITKREKNKLLVKEALQRKIEYSLLDSISDHEVDAIAVGYCYLIKNNLIKF